MSLTRINSRTDYVDEVYKTLLDAISDGTLTPGSRIKQEDIAEQLNVSRSPVLQALRLLKKDGLLVEAPGRGLVVVRLDPVRIGHLYRVRGALDGLAARLATELGAVLPRALLDEGRAAAAGTDVKAMIDADMAFHTAIYEASGNPLIIENSSLHWIHLRRVMGAVLQQRGARESIWDEHEAILNAIHRGDGAEAAALSERHADMARQTLLLSLEQTLQPPPRMVA
jgi:DNA-binding GntR family transcriptional regulator